MTKSNQTTPAARFLAQRTTRERGAARPLSEGALGYVAEERPRQLALRAEALRHPLAPWDVQSVVRVQLDSSSIRLVRRTSVARDAAQPRARRLAARKH